jgi:predicted RNA-binding Zn ribbon-like protein
LTVTRSEPGYPWDFCGGDLAIDFTNTVGSRGASRDEHLNLYGDVLAWADARRALPRAELQRLAAEADQSPGRARDALAALVKLREGLYRVIGVAADGRAARPADLAVVNDAVARVYRGAALAPHAGRLALTFDAAVDPHSLADPIAAPIVRAAVALLTSDAAARVRRCADDECGWLFLDTTRSRTRRWCDMAVCGNRAKVRRFRAR